MHKDHKAMTNMHMGHFGREKKLNGEEAIDVGWHQSRLTYPIEDIAHSCVALHNTGDWLEDLVSLCFVDDFLNLLF